MVIKTRSSVRNYRIYRSKHYFISEERLFQTLTDLVSYYWETGDGLTVKMGIPGLISEKAKVIDPGDIIICEQLGKGHFGEVYKGILQENTLCAVKKLKSGSEQGKKQLKDEVLVFVYI